MISDIDPYIQAPFDIQRGSLKVAQQAESAFVERTTSREISINSSVVTEISSGLSSDGRVSPTIAPTVQSERTHIRIMK